MRTDTAEGAKFLPPREAAAFLTARGLPTKEDRMRAWIRDDKIPSIPLPGGLRHVVAVEVLEGILRGEYS